MTVDKQNNHLELVNAQTGKKISSPGVLRRIEEEALQASQRLLEHMFSATDDLFYELSRRASSNNEQNLYFESMREIRIKKEGLVSAFIQGLSTHFSRLLEPARAYQQTDSDTDLERLSIVDGDELEIDLAQKNMASRARELYKQELYELTVRLDHLLLQYAVEENNNPLDPQQIASTFVSACVDKLSISIKTRLILFKLFEKHVLKQLGHIYADANQLLVDSGILPKVPKNLNKAQSESTDVEKSTKRNDAHAEENAQSADPNTISLTPAALATLMTVIRNDSAGAFAHNQRYYFYANNPGPALAVQDLVSILASKQAVVDHRIAHSEPKVVLRELVNELLRKRNPASPSSLKQSDEDTINLVAMFFDEVLEDPDLPVLVQSLICRLQIPVLKMALRDKQFFSDKNHPVRKLINTITRAGFQFDDTRPLERDPVYRAIVDGIQSINRHHTKDDSIFDALQAELDTLLEKESRKSTLVENRTNQTEIGKVKIRNAKSFSQSALFEKLKDEKLPEVISQFLTNTWLQVLIITYVKEGKDGALWVENEQLISDLIWLCKSHSDEKSKARAQRIKPEILSRIEKGLELTIDNPVTRQSRVADIENTIESLVKDNTESSITFKNLDTEQKEALGRTANAKKSWDEMTALERQQSQHEELSSQFYIAAKEIPEGTWIQYQDEKGKINRCKLSKKIDADTYIFVNRFGFKNTVKSRRDLAYDMQFNRAKLLDDQPMFDKAIGHIMSRFQQDIVSAASSTTDA